MFDYTDEAIVDLMYTPEFRRALSLGVDRDQVNQTFFLGSAVPSATMAAVGHAVRHRVQERQPSATGSAATGRSASVTTDPSTNQLPAPGTSRLLLRPHQPMPAR